MPSLGADMTEGTLLEWLVQPGDVVHRGDIVAVVDTSKSAIDVEVFEDGRIDELLVEPGMTVPVGTPLARLAGPDAPPTHPDASPPVVEVRGTEQPPLATHRVAASPLARRRAAALGVDLADVHGTGPGGSLTRADVEAAAPSGPATLAEPAAPSEPAHVEPLAAPPDAAMRVAGKAERSASMREAIAALMARSKREIPHYYLQTTIDVHAALTWLERFNVGRPVAARILPAALLLKAAAQAAREVPDMNGFYVDGGYAPQEHVHLGVAVSLRGGGLIAPALHDADRLPIDELMAAMKDLVTRARSGRLRASEMSDPTLTVTNLGEQGAEAVHGVIYPPQVALVGFGRVVERPWAVDGMLTVRRTVIATLAADHRVSDGHRGGLYLAAIDAALQHPEEL